MFLDAFLLTFFILNVLRGMFFSIFFDNISEFILIEVVLHIFWIFTGWVNSFISSNKKRLESLWEENLSDGFDQVICFVNS